MTANDVQEAVRDNLASLAGKGISVVFSGKDLLDRENEKLKSSGLALHI